MKTTNNAAARNFTIVQSARFFYSEVQWNAILVIVDSRHVGRGSYEHTVAPQGCVDGAPRPIMSESFVVNGSDLEEVR